MRSHNREWKRDRRSVLKYAGGAAVIPLLGGCLGEEADPEDVGDDPLDNSNDSGGSGGGEAPEGQESVTHATGGDGGTNQVQGSALSVLFEELSDEVHLSPQATQGTVHNARLLDAEEADIAHIHSNVFYDAYEDQGPFEEEPIDNPPLQGGGVGLIVNHLYGVPPDGPDWIDDFPDGFHVSLGPPGGAIPLLYEDILKSAGVWDSVETTAFDHSEAASAYRAGEIDAFNAAIVSYGFNPATSEVFSTEDVKMISLTEESLNQLIEEKPYFEPLEIEEDHPLLSEEYHAEESPIYATAIPVNLVFGRHVSDDIVYHIMETTFENTERMQELETTLWGYGFGEVEVEGETLEKHGIAAMAEFPFHPGAAEYLRDNDEWNDDWTVAE